MQQQQQQKQVNDRQMFHLASIVAYTVAALIVLDNVLSVVIFRTLGSAAFATMVSVAAILLQVLMLGVVAALPCPPWARACGYCARFIQIVGFILSLNGVSNSLLVPLHGSGLGIGAIWLIAVSWRIKGATRVIGIPLALLDIVFSLHIVWWNRSLLSLVSTLFYLVWLLLIARVLHTYGKPEPAGPKQDSPWPDWHFAE